MLGVALVAGSALGGLFFVLTTGIGLAQNQNLELANGGTVGSDFAMVYAAATVMGDGGDPYDKSQLVAAMNEVTPFAGNADTAFGVGYHYPPPLAMALQPVTRLGYGSALIGLLAGGFVALIVTFRLLGVHSVAAIGLAVFSAPVLTTLRLGQFSLLWLLIFSTVYALGKRGHLFAAGAIAGILVLKPTLLLAFVVLLVVRQRDFRRMLAGIAVSLTGIVVVSMAASSSLWIAYPATLVSVSQTMADPGYLLSAFSLPDFLLLLGSPSIVAWGFGALLVGASAYLASSRPELPLPVLLGLAILVSLMAMPKSIVYDWAVLIVPAAIVWNRYPDFRDRWIGVGGALAVAAIISPALTSYSLSRTGLAIQIASIALVSLSWVYISVCCDVRMPRTSQPSIHVAVPPEAW